MELYSALRRWYATRSSDAGGACSSCAAGTTCKAGREDVPYQVGGGGGTAPHQHHFMSMADVNVYIARTVQLLNCTAERAEEALLTVNKR